MTILKLDIDVKGGVTGSAASEGIKRFDIFKNN